MEDHTGKQFRLILCILTLFILQPAAYLQAADEEGCIICHKYPGLARIDLNSGVTRLFYVSDQIYTNSVHGAVLCRNCHLNLDVIPHTDAKKVDCATKCHIKEPSTDKEFSHGTHYTDIDASVHGKFTKDGKEKKFSEDMPGCIDCHVNPAYRPVSGIMSREEGISAEALRRCLGCHEDKDWTNRFYQHFSHRLQTSKAPLETVKLCLRCHKDGEMMDRHGLITTSNYKDSYHWKGVLFGDPDSPDCIGCHAPVGFPVHSMTTMLEPTSAVHKNNLRQTCANPSGVQQCHPNPSDSFIKGEIHQMKMGIEETVAAFTGDQATLCESDALRKERRSRVLFADVDIESGTLDKEEIFHRKVYSLVRYVYTLLIAVVIGGMLVHQFLDYYRTLKSGHGHGEEN